MFAKLQVWKRSVQPEALPVGKVQEGHKELQGRQP